MSVLQVISKRASYGRIEIRLRVLDDKLTNDQLYQAAKAALGDDAPFGGTVERRGDELVVNIYTD